jgi:hypothetical protein
VLLVAVALVVHRYGTRLALLRAGGFAILLVAASLPLLLGNAFDLATDPVLYAESELGNLLGPLNEFQAVGIWPVGDFRLSPSEDAVTVILIAVALAACVVGTVQLARLRELPLLIYAGGGVLALGGIFIAGSPWVDAKGLTTVSPAVLALAMVGAVALWHHPPVGQLLAVAIAFGVLWSNALAYREVNLGPYDQLRELEEIGEEIAGEGPTLMTMYQPYGVRHFLRDSEPEGVSELRYRPIPLRDGGQVPKGESADTDQLDIDGLLVYRTLVLRRSPGQSRPPSPYSLVDRRHFFEVWQRPSVPPTRLVHTPLGDGPQPTGYARCDRVQRLAAAAGPDGALAYSRRPANVVYALADFDHPGSWTAPEGEALLPDSEGSAALNVELPSAGRWRVWLGGTARGEIELLIDGREVSSARHVFNYAHYSDMGEVSLGTGPHRVELRYHGADLHPGSGGNPEPLGPLVFSRGEVPAEVMRIPASEAVELCGERLDWIEAIPAA